MLEQELDSHIRSVTVYRSGAHVTRVAKLDDGDGELRCRLPGLPLTLEDGSVSCRMVDAEGQALPGRDTVAHAFKVVLQTPATETRRAETQELRELRLRLKQLQARAHGLVQNLDEKLVIAGRPAGEPGVQPNESPLHARLALLKFSEQRQRTLYGEHTEVVEKIEAAERRLEELEANEERASTAGDAGPGHLQKCLVVNVTKGASSSGARIEFDYFVAGARWAPSYTLRIGDELREAELSMRAMVSQQSGEDWSGVRLTLSTAERQRWSDIPELKSIRIGRRQAREPKRGWRPPPPGSDELFADYDNAFGEPAVPTPPVASYAAPISQMMAEAAEEDFSGPADSPMLGGARMAMDDFSPVIAEEFEDEDTAERSQLLDKEVEVNLPPMPSAAFGKKLRKSKARSMSPDEPITVDLDGSESGLEEAGAVLRFDDTLLDYGRLRMAGAQQAERGVLRRTELMALYRESLVEFDGELEPLLQQLVQAQYRAQDIASVPSGHHLAWAEDYDYAYQAQSHLDIQSDGQFRSVPVLVCSAQCTPLYVVVPRESTDVFRTLILNNALQAPLLRGPMDVYWNDNFLLTSEVDFTPPEGEVELGLGVDQNIKVVRNTNYREETVGLMGGALELTHKISIEIANNGGHAVNMQVRERVPVPSRDEDDIKVEIRSVSPEWESYHPHAIDANANSLRGGYQWQLNLAGGERTELTASYEVRLPSKFELRGGNRREW